MYICVMSFYIVVSCIPYYCALASYLDHYSVSLDNTILNWKNQSDEVIDLLDMHVGVLFSTLIIKESESTLNLCGLSPIHSS